MKLLFDQNLSFKLIDSVGTAFSNSKHVNEVSIISAFLNDPIEAVLALQ